MNQSVERLKIEGFKITSRNQEAVYMSKGADHRVVLQNGLVKRGKPAHRGR